MLDCRPGREAVVAGTVEYPARSVPWSDALFPAAMSAAPARGTRPQRPAVAPAGAVQGLTETGFGGLQILEVVVIGIGAAESLLELGGGPVAESFVQAVGVEPGDPLDDRQFKRGAGAPDTV